MIKVINPLFRKIDATDRAYSCNCMCNTSKDNYSDGKSWVWIPGGSSCGCACNGTKDNKNANSSAATNS